MTGNLTGIPSFYSREINAIKKIKISRVSLSGALHFSGAAWLYDMQVQQQADASVGREQSGCLRVCLRNKLFVRGGYEMLLLGAEVPIQWDSLLFCLLKWEKN